MKYVYDIILNFNEFIFENYEWKENDYIDYIKKIPVFKVSDQLYKKILDSRFFIEKEFLDKIKNLTEIYSNKSIKIIEYAVLFACDKEVIAVEFNNKCISIMKSKLQFDEEYDALEVSSNLKEIDIKTEVISINDKISFDTRLEREKKLFLNREIKTLFKFKNIKRLKYIYFECFNEFKENINDIYKELMLFIEGEWNTTHDKIYELLLLININNG